MTKYMHTRRCMRIFFWFNFPAFSLRCSMRAKRSGKMNIRKSCEQIDCVNVLSRIYVLNEMLSLSIMGIPWGIAYRRHSL